MQQLVQFVKALLIALGGDILLFGLLMVMMAAFGIVTVDEDQMQVALWGSWGGLIMLSLANCIPGDT